MSAITNMFYFFVVIITGVGCWVYYVDNMLSCSL